MSKLKSIGTYAIIISSISFVIFLSFIIYNPLIPTNKVGVTYAKNYSMNTTLDPRYMNFGYVDQPHFQFRMYNENTNSSCAGKVMFTNDDMMDSFTTCLTIHQMFNLVQKSLIENDTHIWQQNNTSYPNDNPNRPFYVNRWNGDGTITVFGGDKPFNMTVKEYEACRKGAC